MISATDITFAYDRAPVVQGVTLAAHSGQVVGLIGPNGSGKTTLLRILYAALSPHHGVVSVDDRPVPSFRGRQLARTLAVVIQESPMEMPITAAEVVLLGRAPHRRGLSPYTTGDHRLCAAALRRVGARDLADRSFSELSGGEKQRVLIARTLAQQAPYLLLDEPTNHLDVRYQHEVLSLVRALEATTIVVLHDLNLAARYCDQLVLLDGGSVACAGSVEDVLVPSVLQAVYGVAVDLVRRGSTVQLIFSPLADGPPAPPGGPPAGDADAVGPDPLAGNQSGAGASPAHEGN